LALPRAAVVRLVEQHPGVASAMLSSLARMVRQIDDRAADLVLLDLTGRVAKYLAAAAATSPDARERPDSTPVPVDIRLSQGELARLVGGSRQQVNRIIGELARAG